MLHGIRSFLSAGFFPDASPAAIHQSGKSRISFVRLTFFTFLAFSALGQADTLWLENGDKLTGKILQLDAGKLNIKTEYAGTVEVDWRHVRAVDSDQQLWITLVGEKEPRLRVLRGLSTGVEIEDIDLGKVQQFSVVWSVAAIHQEKPVLADSWQLGGEVRAGIDSKIGNTNREIYTFEGEVNIDDQWNKNTFEWDLETKKYTTYDVAEWMLGYSFNRFFDEHVFAVATVDWGYESGADDRVRTLVGSGVGYRFWETSQKKLQTSIGLSRLWERYSINPDQDDYVLTWLINYRTQIAKNLQYYNNNKLFYRLGEKEILLNMRHGFRVALNRRMSLRFSQTFDYDSQALTSVKQFDSQIKVSLGYQW